MDKYRNRQHAGQVLANALRGYADRKDVIVLALPRGGVPVAYEIASALPAPLDVFVVRKLGVPGHEELAMGAIAGGDAVVFNDDVIEQLSISRDSIFTVMENETKELKRRELAYRGEHVFPAMQNKTAILVDDGIATGATMRAAIKALRHLQPKNIIVAVPVAARDTCQSIAALVTQLICPLQPNNFHAVAAWYDEFSQTEDGEVSSLLKSAREKIHG